MQRQQLPLNHLPIGKKAFIDTLLVKGGDRRRMLDLGLVAGTEIEAVQKSPAGDPIAYLIRGAVIALRNEDANKVMVNILT